MAAGVLTLFVIGVYKIYSSVTRTGMMGSWSSAALTQIRNGWSLLRIEISRATPPELVTQMGSQEIAGTEKQRKLYVPATIPYETDCSKDEKILEFYMCQPGRKDVPGLSNLPTEIMMGSLEVKNRKILYRRSIVSQDPSMQNKTPELFQVICDDPAKLRVELNPAVGTLSVRLKNFVKLTVVAQHPRYKNTQLTESVDAPFEVEFAKGGFP